MQKKGIAVVLPVYNGAEFLESCVRSVQEAGERVCEIIIVDDGSTDGTSETARVLAVGDKRIHVIHSENHGCYAARLRGIESSSSPYIAFIDVDDRYINGALDHLADLIEDYSADVAVGNYEEITFSDKGEPDNNKSLKGKEYVREPTEKKIPAGYLVNPETMWRRIMKWKTQEFVCYVWNKLYKREILTDLKYADGINQGEDVLLTCQAFLNVKKIAETKIPVYQYFQNQDSLTKASFGDGDIGLLQVWDTVIEIIREKKPDLLQMAQFNRWRTDFTLITRLILAGNGETDKRYAADLAGWRESLKKHWKDLISPHAMPRNRELLVIAFRFFFVPTRFLMRAGRKMIRVETGVLLHSGDKTRR